MPKRKQASKVAPATQSQPQPNPVKVCPACKGTKVDPGDPSMMLHCQTCGGTGTSK
jgi:hypothetical protein